MAARLSIAVHREIRAAARDVCKRGGACRALAWARTLRLDLPTDCEIIPRCPISDYGS